MQEPVVPSSEPRASEPGPRADERLATYGTLAPGRPNHHHVQDLPGRWFTGHVHGHLFDIGWGAALGYPGIVLDPEAPEVAVHVLESPDLPAHWARLDAFEGPGYDRVTATVHTPEGTVAASIYVVAGGAAATVRP